MAITYPRDLPSYRLTVSRFDLMEGVESYAHAQGARLNFSQINDPVWKATIATAPLDRLGEQTWSSWMRSMRGGMKTFTAYDKKRDGLFAYPNAAASTDVAAGWNGTGTPQSLTGQNNTIGGLPVGLKLTAGDRLGLELNGMFSYHEILETVTAGAGGTITTELSPRVPAAFLSSSTVVRLWRPRAKFTIDWRSWDMPNTAYLEIVSFEAYQSLR